jgi:hypothetical protein
MLTSRPLAQRRKNDGDQTVPLSVYVAEGRGDEDADDALGLDVVAALRHGTELPHEAVRTWADLETALEIAAKAGGS